VVIWSSNNGNVNSGNCLALSVSNVAAQSCPSSAATSITDHADLTWGPANGPITMTNLFAVTPTALTGTQAVQIVVLRNGVATGLSCTVTAPATSCFSSGTATLSQGDFVSVQITNPATGTFVSVPWRASFSLQ
jgi:hypothetical protein